MLGKKVKLEKSTYEKARVASEMAGCASLEEFVERAVIAEADKILMQSNSKSASEQDVEEITNQLRGLGYLE